MKSIALPPVWLIILLVGLSQLSETVYSPSLPDIADALQTSNSMVEYTLTIYLFAFGIGTLFWGKLSDSIGRKKGVIAGLIIYIFGCIGCYLSTSIEMLMLARFIQAFGGSIGSVLAQAICRDAFHGPQLGKVYSIIGSALALFPAIGPIIGGGIAEFAHWPIIFIFLTLCGIILTFTSIFFLPETHHPEFRQKIGLLTLLQKMATDKKVLCMGAIVSAGNGILFSFFAEGPFYLIDQLGLSPIQYGFCFFGISLSMFAAGIISKKLHSSLSSERILGIGIKMIFLGAAFFSGLLPFHSHFSKADIIIITIGSMMIILAGVCIAMANALSLALVDYKAYTGSASSIFGFFYYSCISLFTLGMGWLHNDTLYPMPLYFLALSILMLAMYQILYINKSTGKI
jgi:DHA1 family bicyclomycin/chloramphenicol resistance-like MFS transporter